MSCTCSSWDHPIQFRRCCLPCWANLWIRQKYRREVGRFCRADWWKWSGLHHNKDSVFPRAPKLRTSVIVRNKLWSKRQICSGSVIALYRSSCCLSCSSTFSSVGELKYLMSCLSKSRNLWKGTWSTVSLTWNLFNCCLTCPARSWTLSWSLIRDLDCHGSKRMPSCACYSGMHSAFSWTVPLLWA